MATGYIMLDTPRPEPQQGTYPRRGGFRPSGTAIVHTSEGAWRNGVAALTRMVLTRADYGCYHRACDWQDIALYYPWEWETWQDTQTNNWAVGIAAACKTSDWGNMPADVEEGFYRNLGRMAADFVAYMRDEYGVTVPLRRISGAEARARVPGFCAHGDSGIARSDPGANFDWARFFRYTAEALGSPTGMDIFMTLSDAEQRRVLAAADRINGVVDHPKNKVLTTEHIPEIAKATLKQDVPWYGFSGAVPADGRQVTNLEAMVGWHDTGTAQLLAENAALKEMVRQLSVGQGVTIDYRAIAKAVNDDAAERLRD